MIDSIEQKIKREPSWKFLFVKAAKTLTLVLVFVPILMWLALHSSHYLPHLSNIMAQNHVFFTVYRVALIYGFYTAWPLGVKKMGALNGWSDQKIHYWVNQRIKLSIWLLVFDLLVCENVFWGFIHWL